MPSSPFFARIREQVLQLTAAVPEGRVCSFRSIGDYLDVMPRHVAYLLSQLADHEKHVYPWHRVISGDLTLGRPKRAPDGRTQAELLRAEGVPITGNRVAAGFEHCFIAAEQLPSGLPKQHRPADAPAARSKRT